jgi:4-aminobutyrate aminotransferase
MRSSFRRCFAGLGTPVQNSQIWPGVKHFFELVIEEGKGCDLWTTDGRRFLDATSGIGVLSTGHCHPTVVKAVQAQAAKISHAQQMCFYSSVANQLIDRLGPIMPKGLDSFFFANSGAEAVEGALRMARQATKKDTVISFLGGYHGRTSGSLAVTSSSSAYRGARAGPLPAGTAFARYPYLYAGVTADQSMESLDLILLQQAKASEIAAVIIEPVLGEGGYVVPPKDFFKRLRKWCTENEILLIADEVQSGYGRTGRQWACDHFGVVPDILVSAKGIASGYPLAMVATRAELTEDQPAGSFGGTYGANAVACAAALATLDVFEQEKVLDNVKQRGEQLITGLKKLSANALFAVGEVRGLGLMVAVEFDTGLTGKGFAAAVMGECFKRGLMVLTTGHRETIRLIPPLIVTEAQIDEILETLDASIVAALAARPEEAALAAQEHVPQPGAHARA